jgi:hypothetical protein
MPWARVQFREHPVRIGERWRADTSVIVTLFDSL